VAVDTYRHFNTAAQKCFVTQPTLSMQIQKLEDELGVKLFDRSKQPVIPTDIGVEVVAQARVVLREAGRLHNLITDQENSIKGDLHLAIIPTLAPYLLPLFIRTFTQKYPLVKLKIREAVTEDILDGLRKHQVDAAIIATPVENGNLNERVLFYEELLAYASPEYEFCGKTTILPEDIDPASLLLLEEGHCLRAQIYNLCELHQKDKGHRFDYESGSLETLKRMVEKDSGVTILPELATLDIADDRQYLIKHFTGPVPTREVSLVTHRDYLKVRLINLLEQEIKLSLPKQVLLQQPDRVMAF
jgi:LysR family hydrogen peroxide-inducible transcriptional activator